MEPRIRSLHVHPVKSCRAIDVTSVRATERGLDGDREFAFVDDAGRVLTQRQHPCMATVDVGWDGRTLTLAASGHGSVAVDASELAPDPIRATVHGVAIDSGTIRDPRASTWMTALLGTPATLVRRGPRATRVTDDGERPTTLVDGSPISVLSVASMDALNARLDAPLPIDRFRANVIVDGVDAFFEDRAEVLTLGALHLDRLASIQRCVMIQTDQHTGERGIEPTRTLREIRSVAGRVYFGRYFVVRGADSAGVLSVGDRVAAS